MSQFLAGLPLTLSNRAFVSLKIAKNPNIDMYGKADKLKFCAVFAGLHNFMISLRMQNFKDGLSCTIKSKIF